MNNSELGPCSCKQTSLGPRALIPRPLSYPLLKSLCSDLSGTPIFPSGHQSSLTPTGSCGSWAPDPAPASQPTPLGKREEPTLSAISGLQVPGAWGTQLRLLPRLRLPPSTWLPCVSVITPGCYFLVLQVFMEYKDPILKKDNSNNDYCLNYKSTLYLGSSVLHTLILPEKVLSSSSLQMKKLRFKGSNNSLELI